ncbi:MAG: ATP synthase F1 subunit delta [Bacteroidota bacterium]
MNESRAAIRYAKATLDYAVEKKMADKVDKDMRDIVATLKENKELGNLLGSPVVKMSMKSNILKEVFAGTTETTKGVIETLVGNKRIELLEAVCLKYIILNEKRKGEDIAKVTTAVPLNASLEKKVLQQVAKLTGKKLTIENIVDESILGGFVLRVGDLQYDASIAQKLDTLKREFTNNI